MTLPDGSPIVPKNVRDALKVILADIETNYARIVWTLKDFPVKKNYLIISFHSFLNCVFLK